MMVNKPKHHLRAIVVLALVGSSGLLLFLYRCPILHSHPKIHSSTSSAVFDVACTSSYSAKDPRRSGNKRYDALCLSIHVVTSPVGWEFAGPTTYVTAFDDDYTNDAPKLASAAAVQNVVQAANNTWFIGSVNGGIWRTKNLNPPVHWENVLDGQPVTCTSMSALHVSHSDPSTIYAGCGGSTSGEQGYDWNVVNSGDWGGVMISNDLGNHWRMLQGFPENYYVTDIVTIDEKEIQRQYLTTSAATTTSTEVLLVSAQSHLWNRDDGGIWRSVDGGATFDRVSNVPTFTFTLLTPSSVSTEKPFLLATHGHSGSRTASLSRDAGRVYQDLPLQWRMGAVPFYTCATQLGNGDVVIGGLTRLVGGLANHTDSQLFVLPKQSLIEVQTSKIIMTPDYIELKQPMRLDQDSMPKDRMALFGDPEMDDLLYVVGNAEALAWRVNVTTDTWEQLWDGPEVVDQSIPHGDCRNLAWQYSISQDGENASRSGRLLLVSDGGLFARIQPRSPGGRWVSLNGDYSGLELVSAKYDWVDDRYVAGAQDNCAIVTKINATSRDVGLGFVDGDGTVTAVDSNARPSRLFGTTQFLGVGRIDDDPREKSRRGGNDDGCGGLCMVQGEQYIRIPIGDYFPDPSLFPFFVHPYVLNAQDPTRLNIWVNGSSLNVMEDEDGIHDESHYHKNYGAFFEFHIPYTVKETKDIGAPTRLLETPPGAMILDFVSGGKVDGNQDSSLLVALSTTHLYMRIANESLQQRPLPITFAMPVTLQYDYTGGSPTRILGPLTHHKTAFLSVSKHDANMIAITGWESVDTNDGEESIFVTFNGGKAWTNFTGNLRDAVGVSGKVRPRGMDWVPLVASGGIHALLVGTSNGIYATVVQQGQEKYDENEIGCEWHRLGSCQEFPIVSVSDVIYSQDSNTLVAATYGRGIYMLRRVQKRLKDILLKVEIH